MMPLLFERHRKGQTTELFPGFGFYQRQEAQQRYWQMCQDYKARHGDIPGWACAILVGRARAITAAGPGERTRIGRRMRAARGGHALQDQLRLQGLTGAAHPYCIAARMGKARKAAIHKAQAEEKMYFDDPVTGRLICTPPVRQKNESLPEAKDIQRPRTKRLPLD